MAVTSVSVAIPALLEITLLCWKLAPARKQGIATDSDVIVIVPKEVFLLEIFRSDCSTKNKSFLAGGGH
jgi:hypothetical protein